VDRAGVDVYVIDSGVFEEHKDFEGRATNLASFVPGEEETDTCGHGMY
jgi:cerevisin